ncbi:MAG TPA: septal ring lytic transglycosylase RlpA family protein [Burkholderiales bacterium]|nr:septal ring lytic transglycosylase RlpA family protein [Burkholderiales bacterium]
MNTGFLTRCAAVAAVFAVGACSSVPRGGYFEDDGPQARPPIDVMQVPDAVPRDEPLSGNGNKPYTVFGVNYTPLAQARGYRERGVASWYGRKFHGRRTSSGEPYDMYAMTAAHRTLPLPSYVRVRNLQSGRSVVVRVNDRGPFLHNRLLDLSYTAAARLGVLGTGTALVEIESVTAGAPAATVASTQGVQVIGTASAAALDAAPPRLSVQVGAFSRYENATNLRDRLQRAGFAPIYINNPGAATVGDGAAIYRVRIGPLATVEQGDRMVSDVARYGIADALLVVD